MLRGLLLLVLLGWLLVLLRVRLMRLLLVRLRLVRLVLLGVGLYLWLRLLSVCLSLWLLSLWLRLLLGVRLRLRRPCWSRRRRHRRRRQWVVLADPAPEILERKHARRHGDADHLPRWVPELDDGARPAPSWALDFHELARHGGE